MNVSDVDWAGEQRFYEVWKQILLFMDELHIVGVAALFASRMAVSAN
jgi:hypothetical protein